MTSHHGTQQACLCVQEGTAVLYYCSLVYHDVHLLLALQLRLGSEYATVQLNALGLPGRGSCMLCLDVQLIIDAGAVLYLPICRHTNTE